MRLPDEDQSLAVVGCLNPVAESLTQHNAVLRYAKRREARLELLPAQPALRGRVRHAEGFIMHMGGRPKPLGERHVRTLMQFLDQAIGSRLPWILTHARYPSVVDYKPGRFGGKPAAKFADHVEPCPLLFQQLPVDADPSGSQKSGLRPETGKDAMHNQMRRALGIIAGGVGQVALAVEEQLSGFDIDHPQGQRGLVAAALLL